MFASLVFLDIIWLSVTAVLLLPAIYLVEYKRFGWSSICMLVSIALASIFFWSDISAILATHGVTLGITILAGGYVAAGVATAFIYWIFYNWRASEKFQEALRRAPTRVELPRGINESSSTALIDQFKAAKKIYDVLREFKQGIFEDYRHELKLDLPNVAESDLYRELENDYRGKDANWRQQMPELTATVEASEKFIAELTQQYLDAVNKLLPPRFLTCKKFIVWAALDWPMTLLWLLTSRIIKQLIERLLEWQRATFDAIARITFGRW